MKTLINLLIRGTALLALSTFSILSGCSRGGDSIILYTSQDLTFAETICREFEEQKGISIRMVADSEAVKTVGLAHRLMQEKDRPVCDLFWNNEILRTWQLVRKKVIDPDIKTFGYRSRRLVINTNLIQLPNVPERFMDLTNTVWKGRFAMAYPLFGTTATHFTALRQKLGHEAWVAWCQSLANNEPHVTDGNSSVVRAVGRGVVPIGMTDYDDIKAGQREGLPVEMLPLTEDTLLIPNSLGRPLGKPLRPEVEEFANHLQDRSTLQSLVDIGGIEGIDITDLETEHISPDWEAMVDDIEPAVETLQSIFLR